MSATAARADLGTVVKTETLDIGIPKAKREKLAKALSTILADTYRLTINSHLAHWNVVGPLFKPVHELTEAHYEDLFAAADAIAERVRALGFPAPHGGTQLDLGTIALERIHGTTRVLIETLTADHEALVRNLREAAKAAEEAEDFATHDLLTGRLAFHEKAIWMLAATAAE